MQLFVTGTAEQEIPVEDARTLNDLYDLLNDEQAGFMWIPIPTLIKHSKRSLRPVER